MERHQTDLQTDRARDLRQRMNSAERKLWQALRSRKIGGFKFRRQHPFGPYTLDYYCHDLRLAIEIDGPSHLERYDDDVARDIYMERHGILTLRFKPGVTDDDFFYFLQWFEDQCQERSTEVNDT